MSDLDQVDLNPFAVEFRYGSLEPDDIALDRRHLVDRSEQLYRLARQKVARGAPRATDLTDPADSTDPTNPTGLTGGGCDV